MRSLCRFFENFKVRQESPRVNAEFPECGKKNEHNVAELFESEAKDLINR